MATPVPNTFKISQLPEAKLNDINDTDLTIIADAKSDTDLTRSTKSLAIKTLMEHILANRAIRNGLSAQITDENSEIGKAITNKITSEIQTPESHISKAIDTKVEAMVTTTINNSVFDGGSAT